MEIYKIIFYFIYHYESTKNLYWLLGVLRYNFRVLNRHLPHVNIFVYNIGSFDKLI